MSNSIMTSRGAVTPTPSHAKTVIHFHRPRTLLEKQPYIVGYGTTLSFVSPVFTGYQLCRLYKIQKPPAQLVRLALAIVPHQAVLLSMQLNASTAIKDVLNPWSAFFVVGVLQGGIYGFSNVHFSKAWKLGSLAASTTSLSSRISMVFRGSLFAGVRDMISQGTPFMCSKYVQSNALDVLVPTVGDETTTGRLDFVKHWASLLSTSVTATYLSQGLHNCQTTMQTNSSFGYMDAVKKVWADHGLAAFYRGAEARVGLLVIINILNELLLKPAWAPIRMETHA
jgi:hypothetical protein